MERKNETLKKRLLMLRNTDPFGLLFDLTFLLFGVLLEPVLKKYLTIRLFSNEPIAQSDVALGLIIMGAVAAQGAGLYLRRKRTAEAVEKNHLWDSWFALPIFFILIFHFTLFGIFLMIVGMTSLHPDVKGWHFLFCAPVVGWMSWWAIKNTRPQFYGKPSPADRISDWIGTVLLIFSGIVLTTIAWSGLITAQVLSGTYTDASFGDKISYTLLLLLFFGMYYLPARLSFLVCDFNKPQTWLRYGLVFLPLAQKIWLG